MEAVLYVLLVKGIGVGWARMANSEERSFDSRCSLRMSMLRRMLSWKGCRVGASRQGRDAKIAHGSEGTLLWRVDWGSVSEQPNHYSILVTYVKDYFKWFGY